MQLTANYLALPVERIDVSEYLAQRGRTAHEISKTIESTGISVLSYEPRRGLTEFALDAVRSVAEQSPQSVAEIDAVVVVSQSYDERIPALSTRIKELIKLPDDSFCVDIADGCSGFIKAIALSSMLQREGRRRVLIVSGDLNSRFVEGAVDGTRVLFGDGLGISVFDLTGSASRWSMRNSGDLESTIACRGYNGPLEMNGFEVFRFARGTVTRFMREFLDQLGCAPTSFDLVGLHQASRLVVDTMANALAISNDLTTNFNAFDVGNLGAGSISGWIAKIPVPRLASERSMLAIGFGAGLSWGAATFSVRLHSGGMISV